MTPRVGLTKLQIGESGLGSVYTTINDPTRGDSHSTPLTVAVKILKQLSQQVIYIDFMTIIYIRNHRTLVWLEKVPKELIPCYNRNRETGPTAVQRCI